MCVISEMTLLYRKNAYYHRLFENTFLMTRNIYVKVLWCFLVTTVISHVTNTSVNVIVYIFHYYPWTFLCLCVFHYFLMCIFIDMMCKITHPSRSHVFMLVLFSISYSYVVITSSCSFISCPCVNITYKHYFCRYTLARQKFTTIRIILFRHCIYVFTLRK